MFSNEFNGYNKNEVDNFIANLKSSYEKALMDEKLKVLESERKLLENKKKFQDVEAREKNIVAMLETFKQFQAEGNRNLEVLRGEQLRMVYNQMIDFLERLNEKDPGLLLNSNYKSLLRDIESILENSDARKDEMISTGSQNDAMRILLSKMKEKRTESPREIKVERNVDREKVSIKPVTEMKLEEGDQYDTLVDKFLDTMPPEEQPKSIKIQSSGFDLKEAINPKDDLSEIMKAFDFYGQDDED